MKRSDSREDGVELRMYFRRELETVVVFFLHLSLPWSLTPTDVPYFHKHDPFKGC